MLEGTLQSRIRRDMTAAGWLVNKLITVSMSGTPDLIAHRDGRTIYIEVKAPGKRPRALQVYRMKKLEDAGIECRVVDDLKQINDLV